MAAVLAATIALVVACIPASEQTQVKETIITVAGTGSPGYSGDGGISISARVDSPWGVAVDKAGNFYIADTVNDRVRKVTISNYTITTIAGSGVKGFYGDGGSAKSACLNTPVDLAVDGAGNIYIVDSGNYRVRKVTPAGTITTLAGNGTPSTCGDGGPANLACLHLPRGVAVGSGRA